MDGVVFGLLVKGLRAKKGLQQKEMADQSGLSQGILSRIETGDGNPRLDSVCQIISFFNMKLSEFFLLAEQAEQKANESLSVLGEKPKNEGFLNLWELQQKNLYEMAVYSTVGEWASEKKDSKKKAT